MYVFFIHRKLILRYSLPVQASTGESCKTLNIPTNKRNKQINFSENSNEFVMIKPKKSSTAQVCLPTRQQQSLQSR